MYDWVVLELPGVRSDRLLREPHLDIASLLGPPLALVLGWTWNAEWVLHAWGGRAHALLLPAAVTALALATAATVILRLRRWRSGDGHEIYREPKDIVGWLKSLHAKISHQLEDGDRPFPAFRVTVHRSIFDRRTGEPDALEQMVRYVGDFGGPPGRRHSARSGVVGVCARTGQTTIAARNARSFESFREEMTAFWGYTRSEARLLSPDRHSFMAVPIYNLHHHSVLAVLFLDAPSRLFYENEPLTEQIVNEAETLTEMLNEQFVR